MNNLSIIQIFLILFIAHFASFGIWGLLLGSAKSKAPAARQTKSRVVYRDVMRCVDSDEYFTLEVRATKTGQYLFCVAHDGKRLLEVSPIVVQSWADLIASLPGGEDA